MKSMIQSSTLARNIFLVFSLPVCFSSVACNNLAESTASKSEERRVASPSFSQQRITTREGVIHEDDSLLWRSSTRVLPNHESLTSIQFLEQQNGWIATHEGSVYRTANGGKKWDLIKPPIPKDAYISSLFFTNTSDGWIASGLNSPDVLESRGNKVWLFQTKDGGQNWSLQYSNEAVQLLRIRFANQQHGWSVGRQFVMRDTLQTVPFLIRTTDEGAHWVDLSGNLPVTGPGNGFTDVYADSSSDVTLLTANGGLFQTLNGGQDWHQLAVLGNEPEQTYLGRLVRLPNGAFLAVGGADSLEGFWGVLILREPDGALATYRVNCYVSDVLLLPDKTLLVAGHIKRSSIHSLMDERQGVILHSSDGGKQWSVVYRGGAPSINALTLSDSNRVWAVGERGLVLSLDMP